MQTLQVSRATLMRDLEWLRDVLGHPIHWDRDMGCYLWRESGDAGEQPEEMPGLWLRPSEVLALVTLDQLLRDIQPGDLLRGHLQPLENRLTRMLKQSGLAPSTSEANRLIDGGGVRVDSSVVSDKGLKLPAGTYVVQVGKRKFARVTLA